MLQVDNRTLNSWAIFWYSTIFNKQGLCINPIKSMTKNIGMGESATNTKTPQHTALGKPNFLQKEPHNLFIFEIII